LIFPFTKDKRLKEEDCGQDSGDVGVDVWQDKKRVSIISVYHKDVKYLIVKKANNEETKAAVVYDCNLNMAAVVLKDQMFKQYLFH
jgi:hypothetical protein